jgi:D-alanyl-D-alanine carboxypeptidase
LKDKIKTVTQVSLQSKDRAASAEDMNKLKDLIAAKSAQVNPAPASPKQEEVAQPSPVPAAPNPESIPPAPKKEEEFPKNKTKEIPEDVLKKILE